MTQPDISIEYIPTEALVEMFLTLAKFTEFESNMIFNDLCILLDIKRDLEPNLKAVETLEFLTEVANLAGFKVKINYAR